MGEELNLLLNHEPESGVSLFDVGPAVSVNVHPLEEAVFNMLSDPVLKIFYDVFQVKRFKNRGDAL